MQRVRRFIEFYRCFPENWKHCFWYDNRVASVILHIKQVKALTLPIPGDISLVNWYDVCLNVRCNQVVLCQVLCHIERGQLGQGETGFKSWYHGHRGVEYLGGTLGVLCLPHLFLAPLWDALSQHVQENCRHQQQNQESNLLPDTHGSNLQLSLYWLTVMGPLPSTTCARAEIQIWTGLVFPPE